MSTAELKSTLHRILEEIEDERLLRAIHAFLEERVNQPGRIWEKLTDEQREEVLLAYEESENEENLIDWEEVKKTMK
ncbi:hypothetical protein WBG78_29480 [Chryseolinea sp. T2]|uniref:hypothetical protein n=1 Tax=Chryseolinea sp. T2 TaxID=3129255 RepID=UPI0030789299